MTVDEQTEMHVYQDLIDVKRGGRYLVLDVIGDVLTHDKEKQDREMCLFCYGDVRNSDKWHFPCHFVKQTKHCCHLYCFCEAEAVAEGKQERVFFEQPQYVPGFDNMFETVVVTQGDLPLSMLRAA